MDSGEAPTTFAREQMTVPQLDGGHGPYHAQTLKGASEWHLQRVAKARCCANLFFPLAAGATSRKRSMAPWSLQEVDGNCRNFSANRESMASEGSSLCVLGGCTMPWNPQQFCYYQRSEIFV